MPAYVSALIYAMAIGTVVLDAAIVVFLLALIFPASRARVCRMGQDAGLLGIFVLSTLAVAGTLLMQYMGGLNPCLLCWWQRVFMYPIPLISLIALIKNKTLSDIADYITAFSAIGWLFALYQHLLQILPQGALIPCDATNDCAIRTVFYFDFVTIPWMALTVFAAILILAARGRRRSAIQ